MAEAWKQITTDTIRHVWHPLLPDKIPESINRQHKDKLLRETMQAAMNIRAPGFLKVKIMSLKCCALKKVYLQRRWLMM